MNLVVTDEYDSGVGGSKKCCLDQESGINLLLPKYFCSAMLTRHKMLRTYDARMATQASTMNPVSLCFAIPTERILIVTYCRSMYGTEPPEEYTIRTACIA